MSAVENRIHHLGLVVLLSGGLGLTCASLAQTPICGTINTTTWTPAGNPYIVGCDSTVPSGQTLTIQPGVVVWMGSNVTLTVNGLLHAVGISTSRIVFQSVVPSQYWNRIQLNYGGTTNRLKYCDFTNANTAISMTAQGGYVIMHAEIMNCAFINCASQAIYGEAKGIAGGGCTSPYHSDATLSASIKNCTFSGGSNGCVWRISGQVNDCFGPYGYGYGYANPMIMGNVFQFLTGVAFRTEAASYAGGGNPFFINNTVHNCRTGVSSQEPWDARIQNNIFVGCTEAVKKTGSLSLTTSYNDFFGNATNFTGYPPNYGQLIIPNRNGTMADLFFNIKDSPLFSDLDDHLAANSPCIDAGTPDSAFSDLCLSNNPSQGTQFPDLGAYGGPDACNWLANVPVIPVAADISKSNNIIRVSWGAIPRSEYQVQYLTNWPSVESNYWQNLTNGRVLAVEKPTSLVVATNVAQGKGFFRIQSLGRAPGN